MRHAEPHEPAAANLTKHARERMGRRSIDAHAIDLALAFGRIVFTRGAVIFAIGRKDVARAWRERVDLRALEGLQVVCAHGLVLTAYWNQDFRGLRPRGRPGQRRRRPSIAA